MRVIALAAAGLAIHFGDCGISSLCLAQTLAETTREIVPLRGGETIEADVGRVDMPENRAKPDNRRISLAFMRVRSPIDNPGPPIFMLAGGPGGSSIEMVKRHLAGGGRMLLNAMRGDIVAIDQRGVGRSQPNLESSTLYGLPLDEPGDPNKLLERILKVCREDAQRWREQGVDLNGYTTVESADDIDAVRRALGYDKIVLWGESYGSHLAMATLRRHESIVDRLVLIGPEGPDHTLKLPSDAQLVLERVAGLVKADPQIGPRIPDLLALIKTVLDRLDKNPASVEVDGARVGISKFDVQTLLAEMLTRTRGGIDRLPAVVNAMAGGDFSSAAREIAGQRRGDGVGSAMSMVMDSASGASKERLARIAKESRECCLGDTANFPFPHVAKAWDAPDLGDDFRGPLRSSKPVLIIVGDLDPRTPIRNARELMERMPNANLVVVEAFSHDVPWGVRDIRAAWEEFLAGRPVTTTQVAGPKLKFAELP